MKTLLLFLALALPAVADDSLTKLRGIRGEMVAKATAPINDNYKRDLEKMLAVAVRSGKADEIVALTEEIDTISLVGKTFRPQENKGFHFILGDNGVCWQIVGGEQTGRWSVKGGKLKALLGEATIEVDAKTLTGTVQYRGKPAHKDALVAVK